MKTLTLLLIANLLSANAYAAVIQVTKTVEAKVGAGINPDTEQLFPECIESFTQNDIRAEDFTSSQSGSVNGSARTLEVKSEVLRTLSQIASYENQSVSADVQYLAYGGGASYGRESLQTTSSDEIAVGIRAVADYGRYYLTNVRLKPEYKRLAETNLKKFYEVCGHEYVAGYSVGQGVNIVMKSSSYSAYSYEKIEASANAGVSAGAASTSVQAAFTSVASSLVQMGALQVSINAFGTGELKTASNFIKTKQDVNDMVSVISEFLDKQNAANATKIAYYTQPYPIFNQPYRKADMEFRRKRILEMYSAFRKVSKDYDRLSEYMLVDYDKSIPELCKFGSNASCQEYNGYLKKLRGIYSSAQVTLLDAIRKCANSEGVQDCTDSKIDVLFKTVGAPIQWPNQYRAVLNAAYYKQLIRDALKADQE